MRRIFPAIYLALLVAAPAQDSPAPTPSPAASVYKIGKITVDKNARTVRFPATVQMAEGALEYLLVTEEGKTHESLFVTKVAPYQLHVAMLLLGAQPSQEIKELPPVQLTAAALNSAPELKGDDVQILVSWNMEGTQRQVHAEEWVHNLRTKTTMIPGPWLYTGSAIYQKRFIAQEEGSIVALITDATALINNPRPGHSDDSIWAVAKAGVPPINTPVEITFLLQKTHAVPQSPLSK